MFCPKCGTKTLDDATFCQKCGAKLTVSDVEQQAPTAMPVQQTQPQAPNVPSNMSKKKKLGKLPIIIGALALVIVLIVIVASSNKGDSQGNVTLTTTNSGTEDVSLSETFTNDTTGISFNYPTGWEILTSENEFQIVNMIDSKNNADSIAKFEVYCIFDQDPLGVFTKSEESVREAVNEFGTFLKIEDTLIGDIPAKGLMYQASGLKGDDIVAKFWYVIGENVYQVTCSYSASKADIYEPIFNSIMDSYTIATSAEPVSTAPTTADEAQKLIEQWFAENLPGYELTIEFQYDEGAYVFNLILDSGAGDSLFLTAFVDKGTGEITIGEGKYNQPISQWLENMMGGVNGEMGYDEYAPPAPTDSALYGRWRASDGTSISLDEYGGAQTSMDLRPWWALGKSTALSWEASNGKLKLTTDYTCEYKYRYYENASHDFGTYDVLKVGGGSFVRHEDTVGDGIIGEWTDDSKSPGAEPYFVFQENGTGLWATDVPMTWVADDENMSMFYNLYSTYDYYVSGDMLELFFSNGSKIFTKVGN